MPDRTQTPAARNPFEARHGARRPARSLRLGLALAAMVAAGAASAPAAAPPLIPRDVFFAPAERANAQLSPDGRSLAYVVRGASGPELWMRGLDTGDSARISPEGAQAAANYFWSGDGRRVLFVEDRNGDENFHLMSLEIATGAISDLTPYPEARVENVFVDAGHAGQVLVGLNLRDKTVFDVHRIDLATRKVTLETENPGDVIAWTPDPDFVIRAATAIDPTNGDAILRVRDAAGAPWRDLVRWTFEEAGMDRYQKVLGFTPDGRGLYVQSPVGSNTTRLVTLDVATGKETATLASHPKADLHNRYDPSSSVTDVNVVVHPTTGAIQAVAFEYLVPEWKAIDPAIEPDLAFLARFHPGDFQIRGRSSDDARWLVRYEVSDGPASYFLYERAGQDARFLFHDRPALAGVRLAEMKPISYRARDGLEIPAYLTLPPGVPANKLPLVLLPHGGPWFRDAWGYEPEVQWLANRGYAVLQPQFRGSTGFGNAFLNAGTGGFGLGAMQHDLTDAVRWAIERGVADPRRVAIMGASYGGYATLAGLAFTPELYACGVDMVGPSDLRALIESFPPYWALRKKRWLLRVGDVIADESLNRRLSPVFHAEAIKAPLLIGHGANDPRVQLAASESIVKAMRDRKRAVEFVVYPGEGHGFGRPENIQDWGGRVESFLAKHLGGRAEPWKETKGASAQVR